MMNLILSGHFLIFQNNSVLLVKHGEKAGHLNGVYGIPGGRMNEGENLEDTAIRELFEETGIKVSKEDLESFPNNEYTANIKRKNGETIPCKMTVFTSKNFSGELAKNEETTPEWIDISKLENYNLLPNVENAIKGCLNSLKKN